MNLSARDRKIAIFLGPLVLLIGFWFLVFSPKRAEVAAADVALVKAEKARDTALAELSRLSTSKQSFASDYSQLVRLGKAVPNTVDMPSVIVQLDAAARGSDIRLGRIAVVEAEAGAEAAAAPSTAAPAAPGGGDAAAPAAAGGADAQSAPGSTAENAAESVNESNGATDTSAQKAEGGLSVGGGAGGAAAAPAAPAGQCPAGLECVPLEFEFTGGFFDLASFFHRLKRFVHVKNNSVNVRGRLLTIESLSFATETFPKITAEVKATAYLSDEAQTVAGAAPAPGQAAPVAPAPASTPSPAPAPPVATATP